MSSAGVRLARVGLIISANLFITGVIFGFAALKPVLVRKGVYSELCTNHTVHSLSTETMCEEQELRLNNIFVTSVAITNMASLPAGVVLDYCGPTRTSVIGAVFFGLGNLVIGNGRLLQPIDFDGYSAGFFLISIGSPLVFLSSFQISSAFPRHSGLILSCIMAAFNASSALYVLYSWLDQKTGGVSIQTWFSCYAIIPALFVALQGLFESYSAYTQQPGARLDEATAIAVPTSTYGAVSTDSLPRSTQDDVSAQPEANDRKDAFAEVLSKRSMIGQILSRHFWLLLLFFAIHADRVNWVIQTISEQLAFHLHDTTSSSKAISIFTLLLPLGGVIGIPIFGWMFDKYTLFEISLAITFGGAIYGVLGMLSSFIAQLISISVFVIFRPLLYIFVGDYCARAFGFQTFGRIYGTVNTLVGLNSLILGPINRLVKGPLSGNYDIVNGAMIGIGLLSSALISWSIRASMKAK